MSGRNATAVLVLVLGAILGACSSGAGPAPSDGVAPEPTVPVAVPSDSPQIATLPDGPSPVAAPSPTAVPTARPSATPSPAPTATPPPDGVTPSTDINSLIDVQGAGPGDPRGDPLNLYGNAPLTFDATWLGGGDADCPTAPKPAWLACAAFSLQPPGDTRKVGAPELFVAIHPSASPSIPSELYAQVRVTGHFDDPAAKRCHDTQPGDAQRIAPAAKIMERCRRVFVVTEVVPR